MGSRDAKNKKQEVNSIWTQKIAQHQLPEFGSHEGNGRSDMQSTTLKEINFALQEQPMVIDQQVDTDTD